MTEKCCDFNAETKEEKKKHFRIVHQGFLGCTENRDCPAVFRTEEALKVHANLHQKTKDQCDKCDYTTPFPRYLRYHKEKNHNVVKEQLVKLKENEKFECLDCNNKQFSTKTKLINHKSGKHNLRMCKECGIKIAGNRNLRRHIERFHSNKPFHCDRCGKRFFDNTNLRVHMDSIHLGVVFYCRYPVCDKKLQPYRNDGNRNAHERKRHGQNYNVFLKLNLDSVNKI